ncbi:MAG: hypothetical protein OEW08_03395 [Gammaproteobacteria bacterium]|nr:hypothetical protein [Gammaproteobacteria bacterium]
MGVIHERLVACSVVIAMLLFAPLAEAGGGSADLPRALGVFKLRMTVDEFARVARVTPQRCTDCANSELYASLNAAQVRQLMPDLRDNAGMDFFFFENRLYHIGLGVESSDLAAVRKEYSALYGSGQTYHLKNATSYIKWEDGGTLVTANYQTANEQVFALNYFDWDIKAERDFRVSVAAGQTSARQ